MRIQGYVEIDHQEMTDTQRDEFYHKLREYFLDFHMVDSGDREYYFCILQDDSKLSEVLKLLGTRNPVINGLWDISAIPYGKTVSSYEEGEAIVSGNATYPFDLALHLSHTPKYIPVDEEGNVTEADATEFRPLHGFAGWAAPIEY